MWRKKNSEDKTRKIYCSEEDVKQIASIHFFFLDSIIFRIIVIYFFAITMTWQENADNRNIIINSSINTLHSQLVEDKTNWLN